ncbi:YodD family protein [Escherichia coli]|nr:YodD family protein [Escherichia coli]EFZ2348858.1 YodD family protein [Shigella sonnei]EKD9955162.1 YodD family protein [Escherichia coli]MBS1290096.1 YodD family protein [Escherichia coli]HAX6989745.1 YodD family protein [Escherichia coli]
MADLTTGGNNRVTVARKDDKTAKEYSDTAKREVSVDVDALLAAINEISESEVHRSQNDSEHVSVDGREYHTWRELADAFELDIHDFSVSEVNR